MQQTTIGAGRYSSLAGREIKRARESSGLSQGQVASKARMALSTISNIERETVPISYESGCRLLESLHSLGVDVSSLKNERVENFWSHQENKLK